MRLLNTRSLQFQEFFDEQRPGYAILSHRWTGDETTFKDFSKGRKVYSEGHRKVVSFCGFAKGMGYEWVWIDTCCIDKRSSAELSEAINSMFAWYHHAKICYAYLNDVPADGDRLVAMHHSAWFTRGWTLQELLAPSEVDFCDAEWNLFGNKDSLQRILPNITGIDSYYLRSSVDARSASIATKMSWCSRRQTTRKEDIAYCMLGIFAVNMPLLYGEGEKAFMRLQMEIIRSSADQTVFLWADSGSYGLLALSPSPFSHPYESLGHIMIGSSTYAMTQQGLELKIASSKWISTPPQAPRRLDEPGHWIYCEFGLECYVQIDDELSIPCIVLRRWSKNVWSLRDEEQALWFRYKLIMRTLRQVQELQNRMKVDQKWITICVAQNTW